MSHKTASAEKYDTDFEIDQYPFIEHKIIDKFAYELDFFLVVFLL